MAAITLRHVLPEDHAYITGVVDDWWDGRPVRGLLPRLFFEHFNDTSFVLERDSQLLAFLVGFKSQSRPTIAYIHFAGVRPDQRGGGLGRRLYQHFIAAMQSRGCETFKCITSPVNSGSIEFHRKMGFDIDPGTGEVAGIPVTLNHSGQGQHRVQFTKTLWPSGTPLSGSTGGMFPT
jgi:ribosomal protein S18 acetylase RimI-like enzyme